MLLHLTVSKPLKGAQINASVVLGHMLEGHWWRDFQWVSAGVALFICMYLLTCFLLCRHIVQAYCAGHGTQSAADTPKDRELGRYRLYRENS